MMADAMAAAAPAVDNSNNEDRMIFLSKGSSDGDDMRPGVLFRLGSPNDDRVIDQGQCHVSVASRGLGWEDDWPEIVNDRSGGGRKPVQ
jgi:hypothetical protein